MTAIWRRRIADVREFKYIVYNHDRRQAIGAFTLDDRDAERTGRILQLLGSLTVPTSRRGDLFAVPFDGAPDKRTQAMEVVDFFGLERCRRGGSRAPLAQIDPEWVTNRGARRDTSCRSAASLPRQSISHSGSMCTIGLSYLLGT